MQNKICKSDSLATWIKKNNTQFVSHAIWSCNVDPLLVSGYVHPSEFIVRHPPYSVECELGTSYGERGVLDLSDDIKKLSAANTKLPSKYKLINFIEIEGLSAFKILTPKECSLLETNYNEDNKIVHLKNGKFYTLNYSKEFECLIIEGFPAIEVQSFDMEEALSTITNMNTNQTMYGRLKLIQDIIEGNIFDKKLAEIWNLYTQLVEKEQIATVAGYLTEIRYSQFGNTKLNSEVRCCLNSIAWSYGDVVVLRGQSDKIISSTVNLNRKRNHEFHHKPLLDGQEVQLLSPWENNGEFFALDLSQEDTIIIGSEKALSPYSDKNYQLHSFENMTLSQLDYFKVPEKLRPKFEMYNFFSKNNADAKNYENQSFSITQIPENNSLQGKPVRSS